MHFIEYLYKDFDNMHHTLNDSKVITQSVHIVACFIGGHKLFQQRCFGLQGEFHVDGSGHH